MRETGRHQAAFEVWYAADRNSVAVQDRFRVSERSALLWIAEFGWHARADARDREAAKRAEREAIKRRVKILDEQRKAGELLRRRGTEYFVKHEMETAGDAIRGIKEGVALERSAEGLPSFIAELFTLNEDELTAERERILRRLSPDRGRPALSGAGEDEREGEDAPQWTSEPAGPEDAVAGTDPVLSPPAAGEAGAVPGA